MVRSKNSSRAANDYLLGGHASRMNADVIALSEIENESSLAQIFDPKLYRYFVSTRGHSQRTGFVARRDIP